MEDDLYKTYKCGGEFEDGKYIDPYILKVYYDWDCENPRTYTDGHLSHMLSFDRDVVLDKHDIKTDDIDGHVEPYIKKMVKAKGDKVIHIEPINMYKHGGVSLYRAEDYRNHFDGQWDCACIGVLYITQNDCINWNWEKDKPVDMEEINKIIDIDFEMQNEYLIGNIYRYEKWDEKEEELIDDGGMYIGEEGFRDICEEEGTKDMEEI